MNFEIKSEWPPIIEKIRAVLPVTSRNIFAYDKVIYNPGSGHLAPWLIAHEKVHFRQQGWRPKRWWKKFLASPKFRLEQELEAHQAEYRCFCTEVRDRNHRARSLNMIAR